MHSLNSKVTYLFKKYYNKTASPGELTQLFQLLDRLPDEELVAMMHNEWDNIQQDEPLFDSVKSLEILDTILPATVPQENVVTEAKVIDFSGIRRISIAAAVLIFISIGIYLFTSTEIDPQIPRFSKVIMHEIPPGGKRAVLTLTNGRSIILDSLKNGTIVKTSTFEVNKTEEGLLIYQSYKSNTRTIGNSDFNIISTPRGGEYKVILPDGSKVWLNAASSIKFPTVFTGNTREIYLKGEAYFEVAKNASIPFIVKSKYAEIQVLGTHFNARAYNDELSVKTTLVEGSVKISTRSSVNLLKPGEQAVLERNNLTIIKDVDVEEQLAWKNGLFQFNDASLENVIKQAALWYDLTIRYEGKISKRHFTGKISRKVNASEFLNMLKYAGVEYKRDGKVIVIKN